MGLNRNSFIYNDDGSMKIVTRNEAIKVWVYKVLQTERFRYGPITMIMG